MYWRQSHTRHLWMCSLCPLLWTSWLQFSSVARFWGNKEHLTVENEQKAGSPSITFGFSLIQWTEDRGIESGTYLVRRRTSQNGGHHRRGNGGFCPLETYVKLQNFSQTVGNWDLPNWNQWLPDPATTFDLRGSLWELIFSLRESSLDIKGKMETLLFEVFVTLLLGILCGEVSSTGEVVYAVNRGRRIQIWTEFTTKLTNLPWAPRLILANR